MKMSKGKKRFLIALTSIILIGAIFAVTIFHDSNDVVAKQKVFDGITTNYKPEKQVKILEIVPTETKYTGQHDGKNYDLNVNSELGYFMPLSISQKCGTYNASDMAGAPTNPTYVSRGAVHGEIVDYSSANASAYKSHIYNLYQYGLVKPSGTDTGWYTNLGEYPLYSRTGLFSPYKVGYFTDLLSGRLVDGYFKYNKTGTGSYYIDPEKYFIKESDSNKIYITQQAWSTKKTDTVSVNGLAGNIYYVSGNTLPSINTAELSLPKTTDGKVVVEDRTETLDGNVDFVDAEGQLTLPYQLYKGFSGNKLYFSTNNQMQFKNSDWWNEYVMGDLQAYENSGLDTPYVVKAAKDVNVSDIQDADLIYISGTYASFKKASSDISDDVLIQIYNDEINYKHKAVMMDYASYDAACDNNISKLASLLWQTAQSNFYTNNKDAHPTWFTAGKESGIAKGSTVAKEQTYHNLNKAALTDATLWETAKKAMVPAGTGNGNFVTGNTYVYNHHLADFNNPKAMIDALDNFANGDFITAYKETIVTQGLNAVSRYIEATNRNLLTDKMSTSISPAVCIQYILVSQGVDLDVMKTSLRVLEIEPIPAFLYNTQRGTQEFAELRTTDATENAVINNRRSFVSDYLSAFYSEDNRIDYIEFTSMSIYEFNARNEDLVETYDIIYIGDEVARNGSWLYYQSGSNRNTYSWVENGAQKEYVLSAARIPDFLDKDLEGNIYFNVGERVEVYGRTPYRDNGGVAGWLDTETFKTAGCVKVRYSPRDITKNKLAKLKEFVNSNALVLVAEDLMGTPTGDTKNTVINPTIVEGSVNTDDIHGRVDSSSNLYEFFNYALGKAYVVGDNHLGSYENVADLPVRENVVAVSDIKRNLIDKELLAEYVSTEKLSLNLLSKPIPYSYAATNTGVITSQQYMDSVGVNGTRYLEFKFTIEGDSEKVASGGYSASLYIDINKDGKFSKTREKVPDVTITIDSGRKEATKDDANNYVLSPGVEYTLTREISDDFSGLLNWKLDIHSNNIAHLHDSEQGYTLVKDPTNQKKKIRILQITNNNSALDMEARLYDMRTNPNTTNSWSLLLNSVPDYELYIRTLTVSQYQTALNTKYNEYVASVNASNAELAAADRIPVLSKLEYAEKATDTFFNDFVVQYVEATEEIPACSETPVNHTTPGPNASNINGTTLKNKGYENERGVDMIVCGFGDDYVSFSSNEALVALQAFIKDGKPVLTSHDFIHFSIGVSQNRVLRNFFGADLYGVTQNLVSTNDPLTKKTKISMLNAWNAVTLANSAGDADLKAQKTNNGADYLRSGKAYSRNVAADYDAFAAIEGTGKEVSYKPNSLRNTTTPETHGISTTFIEWVKNNQTTNNSWVNCVHTRGGKESWNISFQPDLGKQYSVENINQGQITNYPYKLKESFRTTSTHSQYFTLDLTSDVDDDGESDVVVWYAFGDSHEYGTGSWGQNPFNEQSGGGIDPANGYYIYNDGNVTYTGAGHTNMTGAGLDEIELFINTLIAAYETGVSSPSVGFFKTPDISEKPITSLIVPYDANITQVKDSNGNVISDSSVLKPKNSDDYMYKFVDPNTQNVPAADGTMVFYRIGDYNFVRGSKSITTRYFLQVGGSGVVKDDADNKMYYTMPDGTKLEVQTLDVNGERVTAVDLSKRIYTYATTGMRISDTYMDRNTDGSVSNIESGRAYGIYLPMNLLKDNASFTILVEAQTKITSISTSGYGKDTVTEKAYSPLTIVKADLLDLD